MHHKRAQSLDSGADGMLLVLPITARCRSDHSLRQYEEHPQEIQKNEEDLNLTKSSNELITDKDSDAPLPPSAPSVAEDVTDSQKIGEPAADNAKFCSSIEIKLCK